MTEDGISAGVGEVDITPALGVELAGAFEPRFADHIERRLYAKALALRGDDTTVVLVCCDTIMVSARLVVEPATARIAELTGVPADHVLVAATHAHSTPSLMPELGVTTVEPDYVARVVDAVVTAATTAIETMVPARIGYGQTPVTGVCFNRRYRRTDGLVECNPGAGRDDLVGPAGPVDPLVTGLLVEDRRGTTIGFWSNLAVHYVGTGSQHSISSDYFGAVGERLRRLVGGDVSVQLTNGCSGDINNVDLHGGVPEAGMARAELAATAVAGAVAAGTMMAPRHTSAPLSAGIVGVEVDRMAVTERDRAIARAFLAGERQDTPYSFVVGAPIQPGARRYFAEMLPVLAELPERATVPVQVIMVGELCVVGLPGEIFVEHGLVIKDRSRSPVTAVVGLAGDHIGYVPTLRATAEGGYETWRNAVSWTAPGTGERLVDAAVDLITELTKIRSTASTG